MARILRFISSTSILFLIAVAAEGQVLTNLHQFAGYNPQLLGAAPYAGVIVSGTELYGTASAGGSNGAGTIFKVKNDGTGFTVLYDFTGGDDGGTPQAGLVLSSNILYGTAEFGGTNGDGTIYRVKTDGTGFAVIRNLNADTDGANPVAGLLLSNNVLYGTASSGGVNGNGTVFKLNIDGTGFASLYSFTAADPDTFTNDDGSGPVGTLVLAASTLYGTAYGGGTNNAGTVFSITTNGSAFVTLYNFTGADDGANPGAGLVISNATLYGTTESGGANGNGNLFRIGTNGSSFTSLYSFSAEDANNDNTDGAAPAASLTLSSNEFYGTASAGGAAGNGTVFKIGVTGAGFTTLYNFSAVDPDLLTNSDGATPLGAIFASGATLYGTASAGGSEPNGTVFKLGTNGTGFAAISSFAVAATNADGAKPDDNLAISGNTLYGTTEDGGLTGSGTVFKVNLDGTGFTTLYDFSALDPDTSTNSDGANPAAGLILSGSTLYGTAQNGGIGGEGTVFKISTNGAGFTTLHSFDALDDNGLNTDGGIPLGSLVLSGNTLYGTASAAGTNGSGALFKLATNGTGFGAFYNFTALDPAAGTNSDGAAPLAALALSGSTVYGTASQGGTTANGTVFSVNTNGSNFTTLYNFTGGSDGAAPASSLLLSSDTLYGTASQGGNDGNGAIFKLQTNGTGFTAFYEFTALDVEGQTNGDGASPVANLILSSNILYGTAYAGGPSGYGTVFQINTNGSDFDALLSFDSDTNGANPSAGLLLFSNRLYGATQAGGAGGDGTVFSINLLEITSIPLYIQRSGSNIVLTWSNPVFGLQASTNIQGFYFTNVPGAASPYTNPVTGKLQFFRLKALSQ